MPWAALPSGPGREQGTRSPLSVPLGGQWHAGRGPVATGVALFPGSAGRAPTLEPASVALSPTRLFLVIEYVNGGDLMFHMQRQRKLPEEHARWARRGLQGVCVHSGRCLPHCEQQGSKSSQW